MAHPIVPGFAASEVCVLENNNSAATVAVSKTSASVPQVSQRTTRSQSGIFKPKEYKDGTIRYDKNVLFSLLLVNQLI